MPPVPESGVIAVAFSDLHLQHKKPSCRGEKDWYAKQAQYLSEVKQISEDYDAPLICAGDVFDRHDPPVELINFAIEHLPHCYAVPGQHDLPHHRYEDARKSAYHTLVEAGRITDLPANKPRAVGHTVLQGFPWGFDLEPYAGSRPLDGAVIAVVHKYVWVKGRSYHGAPESAKAKPFAASLKGFDVAVFGDNHEPFITKSSPVIVNCGSLMRRTVSQKLHAPSVYLIHQDSSVVRYRLKSAEDDLMMDEVKEDTDLGDFSFLKETHQQSSLDYRESLKRYCVENEVGEGVKVLLDKSVEGSSRE